jgi:hypothetical protein
MELSKSNQEIQKIVSFEGGFDILFAIVAEEGMNEGGIISQDCLKLINSLLRENVSNQVCFVLYFYLFIFFFVYSCNFSDLLPRNWMRSKSTSFVRNLEE